MGNQKYANEFYGKFSKAKGCQHIASLYAIKKILDVLALNKPMKILEIGLGIGSISYSILEFAKRKKMTIDYYGTENNEFCLSQLPINLEDNYKSLQISSDLSKVDASLVFDFIIIDGSDESLKKIEKSIAPNGMIFIEGDRELQVDMIRELFPNNRFVHVISNYTDPDYGAFDSKSWSGGGKLIYINPTSKQRRHYFYEKLKSAFSSRIIRRIIVR